MWVRTANKNDLPAVRNLIITAIHASLDDVLGVEAVNELTDRYHSLAALTENLAKPYSEFVVVDDGEGNLTGMAYASQTKAGIAELHQLYVDPMHQTKGLGSMLLDEVASAFPDVGMMRLEVLDKNLKAVEFYKHKGFEKVGEIENWDNNVPALTVLQMEKSLSSWSM